MTRDVNSGREADGGVDVDQDVRRYADEDVSRDADRDLDRWNEDGWNGDGRSDGGGAEMDGAALVDTFPRDGLTADSGYVSTIELPARDADTVGATSVLRRDLAARYGFDLFSHQATALEHLGDGRNVSLATSTSSGKTHVYGLQIARNLLEAGVIDGDGNRTRERNDASTALCVYPMKALTNDQQEALESLYERLDLDVRVRTYDGDTPRNKRREIRETADVVLTNFQALNVYLEHHDRWSRFYSALDLVAIDESHTYTGIQGMHVAWILRRMKRVTEYWGGTPQYVLTSATIGNPGEHSTELVDEPVTVVDDDGSPRGPRDLVLWNPPPEDRGSAGDDDSHVTDAPPTDVSATEAAVTNGPSTAHSGGRKSDGDGGEQSLEPVNHELTSGERQQGDDVEYVAERVPASVEAPRVFGHLTASDVRTLLFCPSRKLTELSVRRARTHVRVNEWEYDASRSPGIEAYNAGLGRTTRYTREFQFKNEHLTGVATTSALELGIDIGSLDATVLMGYPGQRQSFWQRIGRAGREGTRSLAVLVADHRTLDQYIVSHPEYLLETDVEDAVVDTSNDSVFASHVLSAAEEVALNDGDAGTFAEEERLRAAVEMWRKAGFLQGYLDAAVHYCGPRRPQTRVNIYGTDETDFLLTLAEDVDRTRWGFEDGLDLEPVERTRAYRDYHAGAVRLHGGQQFEVVAVDEDRPQPVIELEPVDREYYTRTRSEVNVLDARSEETRDVNGFTLHFGRGTVLVHHHSYDQVSVETGDRRQQMLPTETPPILMETQLCWVEVPETVETALIRKYGEYGIETGVEPDADLLKAPHLGYIAGLHAAEHATIQTAPLELRVDKRDLGGLSTLVLDTHYTRRDDGEGEGMGKEKGDLEDVTGTSLAAVERALQQRAREMDGGTASGWFIYDGVEGGLGFARAIFENFEALATHARDQLRDCRCGRPNGCPACTFDENCGHDNAPLLRASAVDVLDQLLGDADRYDLAEYLPGDERGGERRPALFYS